MRSEGRRSLSRRVVEGLRELDDDVVDRFIGVERVLGSHSDSESGWGGCDLTSGGDGGQSEGPGRESRRHIQIASHTVYSVFRTIIRVQFHTVGG